MKKFYLIEESGIPFIDIVVDNKLVGFYVVREGEKITKGNLKTSFNEDDIILRDYENREDGNIIKELTEEELMLDLL